MAQFSDYFGRRANLEPKVLQSEKDILSAAFGQASVDDWQEGQFVTSADDYRLLLHKVYYAPTATPSNTIQMVSPIDLTLWRQVQEFTFETVNTFELFDLSLGARIKTNGYNTIGDRKSVDGIVVSSDDTDRGFKLSNGNLVVPIWETIRQLSNTDTQLWITPSTFNDPSDSNAAPVAETITNTADIRFFDGDPWTVNPSASPLPTEYPLAGPDSNFIPWQITAVSSSSQRDDGIITAGDSKQFLDPPQLGAFEFCFVTINGVVQHDDSYNVSGGVIDFFGDFLNEGDLWTVIINNAYGADPVMRPVVGIPQIADGITNTFNLPTSVQLDAQAYSIHIDGVHQVPLYDFIVSSNNVVFDAIPISGSKIDVTAYQPVIDPVLGDVGSGSVVSRGSVTSRSLSERFADVVNVKDFGAIGDGVTDDTAAIQAAIDASSETRFGEGVYLISAPLVLPPYKSLVGIQNPTLKEGEWVCQIYKSTNALDAGGFDSIIQMHDGTISPDVAGKFNSGGQRIENICLRGNISTGFGNVTAGGLDASQNAYGIYYGAGGHSTIANVGVVNCKTALFLDNPWLTEISRVQAYGCIEMVAGTSTSFTNCYAGWNTRGGYIMTGVYSTLTSCATDVPMGPGYTFKDCHGVTLNSCGQENMILAPGQDWPTDRGWAFDFQGNNQVTINNHYCFNRWEERGQPAPTYPVYMISATDDDDVVFVGDAITRALPPTPGTDYFQYTMLLNNNAKITSINPGQWIREENLVETRTGDGSARYNYYGSQGIKLDTAQPYYANNDIIPVMQQGTFSPALALGGVSTGFSYVYNNATWTKVGRLVTIQFDIYANAKGSGTGALTIQNLPQSLGAGSSAASGFIRYANFSSPVGNSLGSVNMSDGDNFLRCKTTDGVTDVDDTHIPSSPFTQLYGSITYRSDQ